MLELSILWVSSFDGNSKVEQWSLGYWRSRFKTQTCFKRLWAIKSCRAIQGSGLFRVFGS